MAGNKLGDYRAVHFYVRLRRRLIEEPLAHGGWEEYLEQKISCFVTHYADTRYRPHSMLVIWHGHTSPWAM